MKYLNWQKQWRWTIFWKQWNGANNKIFQKRTIMMFRWTCRSSRRNTWTRSSQTWTDFNSQSSDRDRSQIRSDQDLSQISSDQDFSQLSSVQYLSQISSDQDNLCNHSLIKRSLFQLTELWPKLADNWTNLIFQPLSPDQDPCCIPGLSSMKISELKKTEWTEYEALKKIIQQEF